MARTGASLQERFEQFHIEHPEIYKRFRGLAQEMYDLGWRYYAAGTLYEVLRWHCDQASGADTEPFKLNNDFRSRYARKLMEEYPQFRGFFKTRKLRA